MHSNGFIGLYELNLKVGCTRAGNQLTNNDRGMRLVIFLFFDSKELGPMENICSSDVLATICQLECEPLWAAGVRPGTVSQS